ncbi:unnamed protein product [Bathycoccus prasinos]
MPRTRATIATGLNLKIDLAFRRSIQLPKQNETSIRGPQCLQYRRYLSVMRLSISMPRRSAI